MLFYFYIFTFNFIFMVKNHMVLLSCPVKSNSSPVQVQSKSSLSPVQSSNYNIYAYMEALFAVIFAYRTE